MKLPQVVFINYHANGLFDASAPKTYGGAEVQLYLLAHALAESKRCQVRFITATAVPVKDQVIDEITVDRRWFFATQPTIRNAWHWLRTLWSSLRRSHGDIFIQRALSSETAIIALYSWLHRKKFVYMVAHEWDLNGHTVRHAGLLGRLAEFGIRYARTIIVQSQDQINLLETNYHKTGSIFPTVYPMGDQVLPFNQRQYILWVGRAETWKQPDIFLAAARALPQLPFMLIMPKGNYPDYYKTIVTQAKALPNVTFIESVNFDQIDQYFQQAKVLVNTSTIEGFPNTFIQATKNGTPVVSLQVNPDNVIGVYQFGKQASGDISEFIESIVQLTTQEDVWQQFSNQARTYALTRHDIKRWLPEFLRLIEMV